ncbi:hypothetical protein QAD02_004667 [Eretmocerus hayati]|uniref:Uncharacterized protein n=1 Tax=Eretmocerus hayati TaxID=131215 RepID=A0ACC2NQ74_9HYME|nr:hypothetical protein QAD02_004667 [Eretmocerus hayati]
MAQQRLLPILIVFLKLTHTLGYRGFLDPSDIKLSVDDELVELTCNHVVDEDFSEIKFRNISASTDHTSAQKNQLTYPLLMKVHFESLEFLKNGWHACADARADFFIGNTGDPIVAWIYVTTDLKELSRDGELDSYGTFHCDAKRPQPYSSFMRNGSITYEISHQIFDQEWGNEDCRELL